MGVRDSKPGDTTIEYWTSHTRTIRPRHAKTLEASNYKQNGTCFERQWFRFV